MSEAEAFDPGSEAAVELLDAPPGDVGDLLATDDEAIAAARRQPLAAVTALAFTLQPEEPSPGLRDRLMACLSGDETQLITGSVLLGNAVAAAPGARTPGARASGATASGAPVAGAPAISPPAQGMPTRDTPSDAARQRPPGSSSRPLARPSPARLPLPPSRRWAWPAVAALAAAVIALGAVSLGLWRELGQTREQLQRQAADRQALAGRLAELEREGSLAAAARDELTATREQLALVTAVTTEVCPLRPPARQAVAPQARGLLYVAADHQHWYLRAQGLEAPGEGRVYHLWFVVGDRPVSAGDFELAGDEAAMTSPTMPEGTSAALVTVEPAAGVGDRPSGPVVLYGSEMARLL